MEKILVSVIFPSFSGELVSANVRKLVMYDWRIYQHSSRWKYTLWRWQWLMCVESRYFCSDFFTKWGQNVNWLLYAPGRVHFGSFIFATRLKYDKILSFIIFDVIYGYSCKVADSVILKINYFVHYTDALMICDLLKLFNDNFHVIVKINFVQHDYLL